MQKVRMIAQGRVQGVGFRWGVYSLALEIGGITGRVWNNDDGTVEISPSRLICYHGKIYPRNPQRTDTFFKSQLLRCQTEQLSSLP